MKATIAHADVTQIEATRLGIGQIVIGPISVGQLTVYDAGLQINAGHGHLDNLRVTVSLRFELTWGLHIDMPWPIPDIDESGTEYLATVSIPLDFGDANIPGLSNINVTLAQ